MNAHSKFDAPARAKLLTRFSAKTKNAALVTAIENLDAAIAISEPLADAHTAAELAGFQAREDGVDGDTLASLRSAEDAADRRWMRSVAVCDRAAVALLKVKVDNPADARLKQDIFDASYDRRDIRDIWNADDAGAALTAARRDLRALAVNQPSSPPDAALLALGAELDAAWTAEMAYDISQGDEGYEALYAATGAIADRIRRMVATTLEGFKVQARVVQWCQASNGDRSVAVDLIGGDNTSDSRTAQAIVNGLLGVEDVSGEVESYEEFLASRPVAVAWEAARADFIAAKSAYNAMEDQDSVEGNAAFLQQTRAQLAYVMAPPSDIHQLAIQMTDAINFDCLPDFGDNIEDPAAINYLAIAYQHVRRLTGATGAFLEARRALPELRCETDAEFLARKSLEADLLALVTEYEEMGGRVIWCRSGKQSGLQIVYPRSITQRAREEEINRALLQPETKERLRHVLKMTGRVATFGDASADEPEAIIGREAVKAAWDAAKSVSTIA